jgi:hypothetical protein
MSPALPSVFEREAEALMKFGVTLCRLEDYFFLLSVHYYFLKNIFLSLNRLTKMKEDTHRLLP